MRLGVFLFLCSCATTGDWLMARGKYPPTDCEVVCGEFFPGLSACRGTRTEVQCLGAPGGVRERAGGITIDCSPDCHDVAEVLRIREMRKAMRGSRK